MEFEWWSIEILDGRFPASQWRRAHGEALVEAAVSQGAQDWSWHEFRWGVVLELAFPDDDRWTVYRNLPAVRAALDAVPDPVHGLSTYRGRGGSSGPRNPRLPRSPRGAGSAALPVEPEILAAVAGTGRPPVEGLPGTRPVLPDGGPVPAAPVSGAA